MNQIRKSLASPETKSWALFVSCRKLNQMLRCLVFSAHSVPHTKLDPLESCPFLNKPTSSWRMARSFRLHQNCLCSSGKQTNRTVMMSSVCWAAWRLWRISFVWRVCTVCSDAHSNSLLGSPSDAPSDHFYWRAAVRFDRLCSSADYRSAADRLPARFGCASWWTQCCCCLAPNSSRSPTRCTLWSVIYDRLGSSADPS